MINPTKKLFSLEVGLGWCACCHNTAVPPCSGGGLVAHQHGTGCMPVRLSNRYCPYSPMQDAVRWSHQVAEGLAYLHQLNPMVRLCAAGPALCRCRLLPAA